MGYLLHDRLKTIASLAACFSAAGAILFQVCCGEAVAGPNGGQAPRTPGYVDPLHLYGDSITFDVLRDGRRVGRQKVAFARQRDGVRVTVEFDLAIRFLFFTAYTYSYRSAATWRDGRLVSLSAETDDDGVESRIGVQRVGDGLKIQGPAGIVWGGPDLLPTNHWNAAVLNTDKVVNTLTGRINDVRITYLGPTQIRTGGRKTRARHFRYSGDLDIESWYDFAGRWVKLRFKGRDGSTIEYVCRRCAAPDTAATAE